MLDAWERDSDDDESDDGFVVDTLPPPPPAPAVAAPAAAAVAEEDGFVIDTAPPAACRRRRPSPPAPARRRRGPVAKGAPRRRPRAAQAARLFLEAARGARLPVLFTWHVPIRTELFPETRAAGLFYFLQGYCSRGASCVYRHESQEDQVTKMLAAAAKKAAAATKEPDKFSSLCPPEQAAKPLARKAPPPLEVEAVGRAGEKKTRGGAVGQADPSIASPQALISNAGLSRASGNKLAPPAHNETVEETPLPPARTPVVGPVASAFCDALKTVDPRPRRHGVRRRPHALFLRHASSVQGYLLRGAQQAGTTASGR